MRRLHLRVDICRRAEPGFVGEGAAPQAPEDRLPKRKSSRGADWGTGSKGIVQDLSQHGRDPSPQGKERIAQRQHIADGHRRHKSGAGSPDTSHTPAELPPQQQRKQQAQQQTRQRTLSAAEGVHRSVHLRHVSHHQGGERSQRRVKGRGGTSQRPGDITHGTAEALPLVDLRVLDPAAQDRGAPEPEDRAGASHGDGLSGAHNVPRAHRSRESRAGRLPGLEALGVSCRFCLPVSKSRQPKMGQQPQAANGKKRQKKQQPEAILYAFPKHKLS